MKKSNNKQKTKPLTQYDIDFALESITELLQLSEFCMSSKDDQLKLMEKNDKLYGVAVTILIACAIEAMGKLGLNENDSEPCERIRYIQDHYLEPKYGFNGKDEFYQCFYKIFRCGLAHSGTIDSKNGIHNENKDNTVHSKNGNAHQINLSALVKMAREIFEKMCSDFAWDTNHQKYLTPNGTGETVTYIDEYINEQE